MSKNDKYIMLALVVEKDEERLIREAADIVEKTDADLTVIHINDPHSGEMSMMMDSPGPEILEENIRDLFRSFGFNELAEAIKVLIIESENPATAISEAAKNAYLLIIGHRKMSTFKAHFFDSVDEGIVNNVDCPILVIPKN
mgnify:FL=1